MSETIIFVDAVLPKSPHYLVGYFCKAIGNISKKREKSIKTKVIDGGELKGVLLRNSLPLIKKKINEEVTSWQDTVIGICVDLVDVREKEIEERIRSGINLIKTIKKDSDTKMYKVILYTTRYTEPSGSDMMWLKKNEVNIIRICDICQKDRGDGKTVYDVIAEKILRVFKIV